MTAKQTKVHRSTNAILDVNVAKHALQPGEQMKVIHNKDQSETKNYVNDSNPKKYQHMLQSWLHLY